MKKKLEGSTVSRANIQEDFLKIFPLQSTSLDLTFECLVKVDSTNNNRTPVFMIAPLSQACYFFYSYGNQNSNLNISYIKFGYQKSLYIKFF